MATETNNREAAKRMCAAFAAKASSDFYTGIGWVIGLLFTLLVSLPAIWFMTTNAAHADRAKILANWIAVAWWLNPISLGALGYIFGHMRAWRSRTVFALFVWAGVNFLVSASIASNNAAKLIYNGLIVLGYILLGLLFLSIQFRVAIWLGAGKPGRFFFGTLAWAAFNGMIYWAFVSPEVRDVILVVLSYVLRIGFAIAFVVIQFVAIFWYMAQSRMEIIRPGDPNKTLTFDDYKGQPNLLKLVRQWITLLSNRKQFQELGGQFINGILLYGDPGTGKTLLAKCMAGEAGIAFISIEGSGFRAMFWGVDVLKMIAFVSRARQLAREYGACVAYIDEIDAVGASRGGVMDGQGSQVGAGAGVGGFMGMGSGALTRLLYEMDGIVEPTRWEKFRAGWYKLLRKPIPPRDWHVLFMGSTNRPDVLDPALVRPGRFDQLIVVNRPDRAGRREIVKYYLDKIKTDESVNVELIVSDTPWATPARIMSAITKDAVRHALFDERNDSKERRVSQRHIDYAFQEQALGIENPIEEMEKDQRQQVAYHEAGHAVIQYYLRPDQRIVRVSIIRRTTALGYVLPVSIYDIYAEPLRMFVAEIVVSMAGHVSTKIFLGEYWTGATGDFKNVRRRLWELAHYGHFGPPLDFDSRYDSAPGGPMFKYRTEIVERVWKKLEEETGYILTKHKSEIDSVAQALLDNADMTGQQCEEIIQDAAPPDIPPRNIYSKQLIETIMEKISETANPA